MGANQQTHSSLGHGSKASTSKLAPPTRPAESHQPAPPGSVDESARLVPIFKVLLGFGSLFGVMFIYAYFMGIEEGFSLRSITPGMPM